MRYYVQDIDETEVDGFQYLDVPDEDESEGIVDKVNSEFCHLCGSEIFSNLDYGGVVCISEMQSFGLTKLQEVDVEYPVCRSCIDDSIEE